MRSVEGNKQCPDQNLLLFDRVPWNDIDHGWLFFFCIQLFWLRQPAFAVLCSYRAHTVLEEAHTKDIRAT